MLLALISTPITAQESSNAKPKLIVQITIDQFKSDYLDRFGPAFRHGFKRIADQGIVIKQGLVDHAITDSFPGHGSLASGMYPKNHGFSANDWWGQVDGEWRSIDSADDVDTRIIGSDRIGTSPVNFRATTLADWVKTTNPAAKAIAISAGTKIAMPYGGFSADAIYWLDRAAGRFVSSDFYMDSYPEWIDHFNSVAMLEFKKPVWENLVPEEMRNLAGPDDVSYENGGEHVTFPHISEREKSISADLSEEEKYNSWFYDTPMADEALFELAKQTVINEELGGDGITDYLSITVNTTDNVGHSFGGRSQEILDTLLRVDRKLGEFITFLDLQIGPDGYILAVSGDHGGPEVIEYLQENNIEAARISQPQVDELLDRIEQEAIGSEKTDAELIRAIEIILEQSDFIEDAITQAEIDHQGSDKNPYIQVYRKSWVSGRVPAFPLRAVGVRDYHPARYGIFAQFKENMVYDGAAVVHGSPYDYDRTVPIMFFGLGTSTPSIPEGYRAKTIDVALSLGTVAGLILPDNLDGISLFK